MIFDFWVADAGIIASACLVHGRLHDRRTTLNGTIPRWPREPEFADLLARDPGPMAGRSSIDCYRRSHRLG